MPYKILLACAILAGVLPPCLTAQQCCAATSQPCVCAAARDAGDPAAAEDVAVVRLGTLEREAAPPGTQLDPGDELIGSAAGVAVEVVCPSGSSVKFSDAFRVVLLPPAAGQDCSFSLLSGSVDIEAGAPTEVTSGLVVMGSKRTQYGMRLAREGQQVRTETLVYEGAAECRLVSTGARWLMESGSKALVERGQWRRAGMSRRDMDRTATVNASLDVAGARVAGVRIASPRDVFAEMKAWHTRVLAEPRNAETRMRLGARQLTLRGANRALYQLRKAAAMAPTPQMRAWIAVVQGRAYEELGRKEEAARHFAAAREFDPVVDRAVVERSLKLQAKPSLRRPVQAKKP